MPQHTVLVVEDDANQRALYAEILRGAGYAVLEAADVASAIEAVHAHAPALVLMDVTLPGPSGWNATRHIKEHPDTHRIPVIVVTGRVSHGDRDASFASGGDSFLSKPVRPPELLVEVARLIERRG